MSENQPGHSQPPPPGAVSSPTTFPRVPMHSHGTGARHRDVPGPKPRELLPAGRVLLSRLHHV